MVRSFELERPRTRPHFPKWDLAVVLSALNSSPFEPLDSCGFKELTFKTVFLTALASGRRRSEIHALSCSDVQFSDQSVSLSTFPGFLAKNQLPSVLSSPISLPSLSGQDFLLCPVRALKIYLERVLSRRKGRKGYLFLTWILMTKRFHVILFRGGLFRPSSWLMELGSWTKSQ